MKKFLKFLSSLALLVVMSLLFASIGQTLGMVENVGQVALRFGAVVFAIGFVGGMLGLARSENLAFVDGFSITDTSYAGEVAAQFILKSLTENDTVKGGHIYVKDGIPKTFTIPRWDSDYESLIQDRAATPTSKGSMTVDGKTLTPADHMIYMEFNPRDFEQHWFATQLDERLIDRKLPYTVESVVVQGVLARYQKYLNKAIWNNSTANAAPSIYRYWNGLIRNASNDADVLDVSSPTVLTSSNIDDELEKCYQKIPLALRFNPNFKFFCSYKTADLWRQFQAGQTYKGVDWTVQGVNQYAGKTLVPIPDFPDDVIIGAKATNTPESNMWLGLNSMSDEGLKLAPLQNNSEIWFVKMLMKTDVQYGWGAEVVAYGV
jgi:hypothetical protein